MSTIDLDKIRMLRLSDGSTVIGLLEITNAAVYLVDKVRELQLAPGPAGQVRLMLLPYAVLPGIYSGVENLRLVSSQILFVESNVPEVLTKEYIKAISNIEIASPGLASQILKP